MPVTLQPQASARKRAGPPIPQPISTTDIPDVMPESLASSVVAASPRLWNWSSGANCWGMRRCGLRAKDGEGRFFNRSVRPVTR